MKKDFEKLKKDILTCKDCEKLFGFKPNPCFYGNYNSKIVQISQAPSRNVHITGIPFTDSSGKKLRKWYEIADNIFYNPNNFYITGIAHCYPGKDKKGGDIKPPIYCANKWLTKELNLVENEVYIIVGRMSANYFFPKKDFKELVFNNQKINNKLTFVLPHPSPQNIKWFKDNPEFFKKRLPEIKTKIHKILNLK